MVNMLFAVTSQWNSRIQKFSVNNLRPFPIMLKIWLVMTKFTENRVKEEELSNFQLEFIMLYILYKIWHWKYLHAYFQMHILIALFSFTECLPCGKKFTCYIFFLVKILKVDTIIFFLIKFQKVGLWMRKLI